MKMNMTKDEMKEVLQRSVVKVMFTKTNGETRIMECTLKPAVLPKKDKVPVESPKALNDNVIAVWDVKKEDWRAFRVNSVTQFDECEETK